MALKLRPPKLLNKLQDRFLQKDHGPKAIAKDHSKKPRFVLILGDEGAILVYMHGVKVVRRLFAPSPQPQHSEAIVELIRTSPRVPLYLLVDVIDQQFVRQTFPPVSTFSVSGLVKRRLARDFQPDDLKGSISLGRDKAGRKEWHYLMVALGKTPLVSAWLDLIIELPNELMGVYLLPVEATNYLALIHQAKEQKDLQPWQLLVTHNKVSGFRQVVVRDGKVAFTRVNQAIDETVAAVIAGNIEQEVINTLEYLKRLGFQENKQLDAIVIVAQDVKELLDMNRFGFATAQIMTPLEVAETLELEQAALSADRFGDVVMASAFGITKQRILRLGTPYTEKIAKLYVARNAIGYGKRVISLLLIALALKSAFFMLQERVAILQIGDAQQATAKQTESLKKQIGGLDAGVAFKTAAVSTYSSYIKSPLMPADFVKDLMPLMSAQQTIVSFQWKNLANPGSEMLAAPASGSPPAPATTPGQAVSVNAPTEIKVEFQFEGSYQDVEALTRVAKAFITNLQQKMPQYEITNEPFQWISEASKNVEISLDQVQVSNPIPAGKNKVMVIFRGPKKDNQPGSPPPATGAPR